MRYEVLHLQQAYGDDLFFTDLSPGGLLSGLLIEGGPGYVVIENRTASRFVLPDGIGSPGNFNDQGFAYGISFGNTGTTGVVTLDSDGQIADTGYVPTGTSISLGRQNSRGVVVGGEEGGGIDGLGGVIYSPATGGQSFETLGGVEVTRFSAINNNGWIVGNGIASTANGDVSGMFLWVPGEDGLLLAPGFGSPSAINEVGQIVGQDGGSAFLWQNDELRVISDFLVADPNDPSVINNATFTAGANHIGESGDVLGFISLRNVPGFSRPRTGNFGWLWNEEDGLLLLDDVIDPSLGFEIRSGRAIALDGTILASGRVPGRDEVQHFLLTPIPEPAAACLLVLGLFVFWMRRRWPPARRDFVGHTPSATSCATSRQQRPPPTTRSSRSMATRTDS